MANELRLTFQPKQSGLLRLVEESPATNVGFGGSKGGGKSHGGRNVVISRALKYPGTTHMIFRRTYKELWANHIKRIFDQWPFTRQWYNVEHKELTIPTGRGMKPSVIQFIYAEHKGDIYNYQGFEWLTQLRDEATHLSEEEHHFLDMGARYVGEHKVTPKVIYTTNPGSIGHAYVKRIFVNKEYSADEDRTDFEFIQSYSWDNVGWFTDELNRDGISIKEFYSWSNEKRFQYFITKTKYGRKLNSMPETERLQYLMGDWDVFEGQYFSEWRRDIHVIRPFRIPDFWERFCAADWGYTSPACNLWFAVSPDEWLIINQVDGRQVILPPRSVVVYRESYLRKKTTKQLGQEWIRLSGNEKLRYRLLDPSFGPTRGGGVSVAEEFAQAGWVTTGADNDRLQGWSRVREYMAWRRSETGELDSPPHLYAFDTCENLVRTVPAQIHDEKDVEDLDTEGEDHAVDALRYGLMSRPPISLVPIEEMDDEFAEAAMRARHDEQKRRS